MSEDVIAWNERWLEAENRRWETAICFVCGESSRTKPLCLLNYTNDHERFVCDEHKHLDTSQHEVDMTGFIKVCDYTERMYGRPIWTQERWIYEYKEWLKEGRWVPVNVPQWILDVVRKDAPPPEQLSLFGSEEAL